MAKITMREVPARTGSAFTWTSIDIELSDVRRFGSMRLREGARVDVFIDYGEDVGARGAQEHARQKAIRVLQDALREPRQWKP